MNPALGQHSDLTGRVANVTGAAKGIRRREMIGAAVYLASDASSFATGEDHMVAGGMVRG